MSAWQHSVHLDRDGRPRCGILGACRLTADEAQATCRRCVALANGTYHLGARWHDTKPCGTSAAYRRHQRHGEKPCRACSRAHARDKADRRARKRRERDAGNYRRAA